MPIITKNLKSVLMTSNHNYECFNGGCHGMAANLLIAATPFRQSEIIIKIIT
jgi:hypothetical protein